MAATSLEPWSALEAPSLDANELTPEPEIGQVGIVLRAPARVATGDRLLATGAIALAGAASARPGIWADALVFVASSRGYVASGHWVRPEAPACGHGTVAASETSDELIATEYFTFDLVDLLDKPIPLGRLYVYAFLGNHVSNVVTVDVVEPEEAAADEEDDD